MLPFPIIPPSSSGIGGNDAFTVALLHCDGVNGSTTITNSAVGGSTAFTAENGAAISTSNVVFGTGSLLLDGVDDDVTFDASGSDYTWSGDFAIDLRIRATSKALSGGAVRRILGLGSGSTNLEIYILNTTGAIRVATGAGSNLITGTTDMSDGIYRHIAVSRSGTSLRLFVNGVQEGTTATDSVTWVGSTTSYIGRYQGSALGYFAGNMDEIRFSKGSARGWTTTFTPPTGAYT